jgi:hypothetical protein
MSQEKSVQPHPKRIRGSPWVDISHLCGLRALCGRSPSRRSGIRRIHGSDRSTFWYWPHAKDAKLAKIQIQARHTSPRTPAPCLAALPRRSHPNLQRRTPHPHESVPIRGCPGFFRPLSFFSAIPESLESFSAIPITGCPHATTRPGAVVG